MDKTLVCVACGADFVFPEGEQAFFKEHGLQEPKRCPECRRQRKQQREQQEARRGGTRP